jgi:hypothetical protein
MQCDPDRLAAAVVAQLPLFPTTPAHARILDRGAFATVYTLSSTPFPHLHPPVVVRVSTRPVYNPTARAQEKDKIRGYVAVVLLIHGTSLPVRDRLYRLSAMSA